MNIRALVLVFTGMTSAILTKRCYSDRAQGQERVLNIARNAGEGRSVWAHRPRSC
jgi:hypothetical protein